MRSAQRPVRVGFLGAGLIAEFHSKMLRAAGDRIERAGVYDIDRARAERFAAKSGHVVVDSEQAVLDGCDAVYVCTWTSEHERLVAAALDHPHRIAVFCEKPLATNADTARRMTDDVARSGAINQVGLILRRSPAYVVAKRLIDDEAAGRIMTVVFRDDQFIPIQGHYASTWRGDPDRAGNGTLIEHSIHDVDMLHFLVGAIESVSAHQSFFHGIDRIEDVVAATMRFANGATGTLTSVWHDNLARPSLRRVEIFCERRWIALEGDDWFGPITVTDADGSTRSIAGDELIELAAVAAIAEAGDPNPDVDFIDAVRNDVAAWPGFTVAAAAHDVVEALYRSARSDGQRVSVGARR